jgi:glutaredoxin
VSTVTLYGRPGCHLCDGARAVLVRLRRELDFELVECDITADDALHRAYFERIPVIVLDGRELSDFWVPEDELRLLVARRAPLRERR